MKRPLEQHYVLFGNPVGQSLSPLMHNAVFKREGLNARYHSLEIEDAGKIIDTMRSEGISGASITIPHKISVMPYLDALSESAAAVGAVNTITRSGEGFNGDNTDWLGIVRSLKESMGALQGKTFAVLGAGGTARAAVYGIRREGGLPVIINRTHRRAEMLAEEFNCGALPFTELSTFHADVFINTTPVGMFPHYDESPLPADRIKNFETIMDVIYNPVETKLLRLARRAGRRTVSGLSVFIYQGAEQLRLWTGIQPPVAFMRTIVGDALNHEKD